MPSPEPARESHLPEPSFEQELAEVEKSLLDLKARHAQVEHDRERQTQLKQQRDRLQQVPDLQADLKRIQTQLDELEFNLESRLVTWRTFWQIIRVGGLGVVIGWMLAFAVIKSPQPAPESVSPTAPHQQ